MPGTRKAHNICELLLSSGCDFRNEYDCYRYGYYYVQRRVPLIFNSFN